MPAILALGLLLALAAEASLAESRDARSCGVRPQGLQPFDPDITACWHDAALPAAALSYVPSSKQGTSVSAATWAQLQELAASSNGPLRIHISGSMSATSALAINKKKGMSVTGPARVVCTGNRLHPAVIIERSSNIILQHLTFVNCTDSAVIVNATAAGTPRPISTAAAGRTPPHVLLTGLTIEGCSSSSRGGGVAVISSRVVLQDSLLQHNVAAGCGGGLYAENSSLLVMNTSFNSNVGNDTTGDASCRGGALHVQNSWLATSHSSFINNSGVNGSAVLVVLPVGVVQLQDTTFFSNHPRPGVSREFSSSSGAVTVLGAGVQHVKLLRGPPGSGGACLREPDGLAVVRCPFGNNTAALIGGEGGAISAYETFLAVINSTITGTPPLPKSQTPDTPRTAHDAALQSNGRGRYQDIVMTANTGGCLSVDASKLLMSGSELRHCKARFVGGGMSILATTAVIQDTVLSQNYADMGGAIRATNGQVSMYNVSVLQNRGLSTGGGVYLESNDLLDGHLEGLTVHGNSLTGRGGGMVAQMVEDQGNMFLSMHNSSFTHNTGSYGGGFCLYSISAADLQNNYIAHNTALKFGGGMECAKFYGGSNHTLTSVNNTWFNNTALIRGGGAITHPCNMTSQGDRFLANSAAQEGGGFMVYGGMDVSLVNAQVLCNTAQIGAGIMVELSDSGDPSHLTMSCSSVVANGGARSPESQGMCLSTVLGSANKSYDSAHIALAAVTAAAAAGVISSSFSNGASASSQQSAVAGAAKGGGLYVSSGQSATIYNSTVSGNLASSRGAGIYMDRQGVVTVSGPGGSVSHNNCTGGSGGALFMEEGSKLTAADITWSHNQGMFGGAIFVLGSQTLVKLADVTFSNNTAAAGGAIASLGGSNITCTSGCTFIYNRAKVGGALMLHNSSVSVTGSIFRANVAAAASGSAATAATPGSATASETIQYMLGEVQVSAGGAAYLWKGQLKLNRCNIVSNVAWGAAARGGGIFVDDSQLLLINSNLTSNWATAAGGAVLLGPSGLHQLLDVRGGMFTGNGAGLYGGAAAGGLLLPGDAAAAAMKARSTAGSSSSQWVLSFNGSVFANNTAGRQGGAVACSLCDGVSFRNALLQQNGAVETGGGISCVGCNRLILDDTMFINNAAASGGGSCILAAGKGSLAKESHFLSNAAGSAAAAVSRKRLELAAAAATSVAGHAIARSAAIPPSARGVLSTAQQALPACGVVGSGGGLCLGLWDTGFALLGAGRFLNNSALFGAGLFVEACPQGSEGCAVQLNPNAMIFKHNVVADDIAGYGSGSGTARHLLVVESAAGAAAGGDVFGSGADLYVTNATVLVTVDKSADSVSNHNASGTATIVTLTAAGEAVSARAGHDAHSLDHPEQKRQDAAAGPSPSGRHLLAQKQQQHAGGHSAAGANSANSSLPPLAVAEQLAAAVQLTRGKETGSELADAVASRVATGPSKLGAIISTGVGQTPAPSVPSSLESGTVVDSGRLQGLALPVLDQLGGQVADDVAQQLSVQATADFGNCTACQLSGISKVLPVNGTARFDELQLLAQPGSNQTITFKLLSASEGIELPGGGQTVRFRLPGCHWGQATTAVGCFNCTSPLFTFSPSTNKCSICPDNVAYCSSTTLLPDTGYWNSGPLSTRMHKCPRRIACVRDAGALTKLQCLQQQQLILSNLDFITDRVADSVASNSSTKTRARPPTAWDSLRQRCIPVLQTWAATAAYSSSSSSKNTNHRHLLQIPAQVSNAASTDPTLSPYLSSPQVVSAYEDLMCAKGYRGRLCIRCVFPGTDSDGAYGHFHTGCGKCPSFTTSLVTYVLSRLFDILLVGLLILTTLVDMRKRRAAVRQARKAAISKLALSVGTSRAANAGAASSQQQVAAASGAGQLPGSQPPSPISGANVSSGSSTNNSSSGPTAAMWAPGTAPLGDGDDDTPLPPVVDHRRKNQRQRRHLQQHPVAGSSPTQHGSQQSPGRQAFQSVESAEVLQTSLSQQLNHQSWSSQQQEHQQQNLRTNSGQSSRHVEINSSFDLQQSPAGLAAAGSSGGPFAAAAGAFAAPSASPTAATGAGPAGPAAAVLQRQQQRQHVKRGPLFAREVTSRAGGSVINYSPAQLTTVELFEVFKDFLQVLSILQAVLLGWQVAAAAALSAVSVTPMSTTAWVSLDCILPRNDDVALMLPFYHITASLVLPLSYAALLLVLWVLYAASFSLRTHQPFWRLTIGKRLKAPIISSLLVLLSYFYPSLAYTILSVFSCRHLDPSGDSSTVPGEVLGARGWYWTADLDRECFVDPGHRAIALGLGIPGTLLLLAYPLVQGILLAQRAAAGQLTPTSDFFADYGHLVEAFRPRLFYWGSIVEFRKLVLVAVVLGLASIGVVSQLVGCCFVLLGFCAATMGLLPYPYRLLNRLHLASAGVLLAVVWLNLFVAIGEEGGMLSGGISVSHSLALQLLSVALVISMTLLLLSMCGVRLYEKVKAYLDVDKDGKITCSDIQALLAKLQSSHGPVLGKVLSCFGKK